MNDVLGHVVLAGRDENLGTGNLVAAVGLLHRLGAQQTEIGAAMRLGQVHCACPDTFHHLWQVFGFHLLEACTSSAAIAPCVSPGYIAKAILSEHSSSLTAIVMVAGR